MRRSFRVLTASILTASMAPLSGLAQDLVPIPSALDGSSVFVFRHSSKTPPPKYPGARPRRTKEARIATAKRITNQYERLAKVTPRRRREKVVDPNDPRIPKFATMPREDASKLFAGVGEYYIDKNDSDNAINFFREALDLDSNNSIAPKGLSEALSLKGNELLVKDQVKAAKDLFDEALKYNPNNAVAFYGLAEVFSERDMDPESIENYEKALRYDKDLTEIYVPLGILYYQANDIAKADELLTKAVAVDESSPETQFFLGLVRYAQKNNAAAMAAFNKATAANPDYPQAWYYTGEVFDRLGKRVEAAAAYEKALSLKPNYFEAALDLGSEYYKMEKWDKAIESYVKALKLKNDNIQAYISLGDAYRQFGNYEKAESNYNLAVSFIERAQNFDTVDAADTYNKIGFVIARQCPINAAIGRPCRWNVATQSLEKAVALTHDNVDYANLGWAYYNAAKKDLADHKDQSGKEKLEKARANLQKLANADPRILNAPMVNLGMALKDLGEYRSSIDVLSRVVQSEPKWVFAVNELGVAYLLNKNYNNAIDRFQTVIKRDNKYFAAWFYLGKAHFANGNVGEAKKAYTQLRKIGAHVWADRLDRETGGAMART